LHDCVSCISFCQMAPRKQHRCARANLSRIAKAR